MNLDLGFSQFSIFFGVFLLISSAVELKSFAVGFPETLRKSLLFCPMLSLLAIPYFLSVVN